MPQKTVFIRDEDLEKWKAIEKKSEFVHNALKTVPGSSAVKHSTVNQQDAGSNPAQGAKWEGPIYRNKKKGKL